MTIDADCGIIPRMSRVGILLILLLAGCVSDWHAPDDFIYNPIDTGTFEIATWQKITDTTAPVHIYIEGDGHAFNGHGTPTADPTPHGTQVREWAARDAAPNVVYMARPCQYIMSPSCNTSDWTDGRFSPRVIDSMAAAVTQVAAARPVVLIGYSGGALASGLIIQKYPRINVKKWITIAGVLNHADWTEYFGDSPLKSSINMNTLPCIQQTHYVAENDQTVPNSLSFKWTGGANTVVVPGATHDDFGQWQPEI